MKKLAILGSTGSIGTSTLAVVDAFKERVAVVALAAGSNITLLASMRFTTQICRPKINARLRNFRSKHLIQISQLDWLSRVRQTV